VFAMLMDKIIERELLHAASTMYRNLSMPYDRMYIAERIGRALRRDLKRYLIADKREVERQGAIFETFVTTTGDTK